jgi:hypothetical protein
MGLKGSITVKIEPLLWAVESLANNAIDSQDADMALQTIRLLDSLKAARVDSVAFLVLPELARLAHVDL